MREKMQVMAKAKDPHDERIRVNLVKFIEESGYSTNTVADLSGIPQANLGRYTRGENAVPASALPALAAVFGRSVNHFYEIDPPPVDIDEAAPVFFRARPGLELSAEDHKDIDETIERIRIRRTKKAKTKPSRS